MYSFLLQLNYVICSQQTNFVCISGTLKVHFSQLGLLLIRLFFVMNRKSLSLEFELCPLTCFLRKLVDLLRARDTGEIFIEPVDQTEVLDYGDVVKHPMDLSTMRQKVCTKEFLATNLFTKIS